jgi:hypothetical protein
MRYRAATAGVELLIESLEPGTRVSCHVGVGEKEA